MFFSASKMNTEDTQESVPTFNPDQITAMMVDAREIVRQNAANYPGVWSWGKLLHHDFFDAIDAAQREFKMAFAAKDADLCEKWIKLSVRYSMQIITKYKIAKRLL